jgi:hypothetical protein
VQPPWRKRGSRWKKLSPVTQIMTRQIRSRAARSPLLNNHTIIKWLVMYPDRNIIFQSTVPPSIRVCASRERGVAPHFSALSCASQRRLHYLPPRKSSWLNANTYITTSSVCGRNPAAVCANSLQCIYPISEPTPECQSCMYACAFHLLLGVYIESFGSSGPRADLVSWLCFKCKWTLDVPLVKESTVLCSFFKR